MEFWAVINDLGVLININFSPFTFFAIKSLEPINRFIFAAPDDGYNS